MANGLYPSKEGRTRTLDPCQITLGMGGNEDDNRRSKSRRKTIQRSAQLFSFIHSSFSSSFFPLGSAQLHIAAYIPTPCDCNSFDENVSSSMKPVSFLGHDTRQSNRHPLKHAAINTIRTLADHHASLESSKSRISTSEHSSEDPELRNGSNYLLTDMAFFITHEPCVMCSMALLHSRVKDLFYLYPMPRTGGCGGLTCLTTLKGVNHRFNIFQWKAGTFPGVDLALDESIDA